MDASMFRENQFSITSIPLNWIRNATTRCRVNKERELVNEKGVGFRLEVEEVNGSFRF